MKRDVVGFVQRCLTCQKVKAEHQRPDGMLQPLPVPEWKWEEVTMDFVTGLPRAQNQCDAVWVVVDRLTKSAHFLAVRENDSLSSLCKLFLKEIVRLHRMPVSIVSDCDPWFTSHF